jgi:hypothetical protein
MKRLDKLIALCFLAFILVFTGCGCDTTTTSTATSSTYRLTHGLADLEYIISWDTIVTRIPDMNDSELYDVLEGSVARGSSGGFIYLDSDSPAMWLIGRSIQKKTQGTNSHIFGIWMWFFETKEELDEHINAAETEGIPLQYDGDFVTAFVEAKTPVQSEYLLIAGNQICILIAETASLDESLFFDKEYLMELLPALKNKISSIEITPLSWPRIPRK